MKLKILAPGLFFVIGALAPGWAQQKLGTVNAETPEGALLQQIGQENDDAKKQAMLEDFAGKYAKHEAAGWVYAQLQGMYLKGGNPDKALEYGEKLAALDPADLESAHQNLKAAEAKKDPDLVKKWAAETGARAQKIASAPKGADEDDDAYKRKVDYAKQVNTYSEYALYGIATQIQDPRKKIELAQSLRQRNPSSEYLDRMADIEFAALQQTGDSAKALAAAEAIVAKRQDNEEVLLFLADQYKQKKNFARTIEYANKVVEMLGAKPTPAGMDEAAWTNRKNTFLGTAHFLAGTTYYDQSKFKEADESLRSALPLVGGNEQIRIYTLYFLGQADLKLGKQSDALNYFTQCAALKSPVQAAAAQNVKALRQQGVSVPGPKKK
jgi:tetratricopeptide (TPR) repeat protein